MSHTHFATFKYPGNLDMTNKAGLNTYIRNREYGARMTPGLSAKQALYGAFRKTHSVETSMGGIFNFDFSVDGSLLGAACEGEGVFLMDPLNGKIVSQRSHAHTDCVNCIRFLDTRTFVTCSDDTTVCMWDARNLKHKISTLRGHSYWVKNIEYASHAGLLVTSGFDGCIYTWDINRHTDEGVVSEKIYTDTNLMRSRLSPDASKLIISTTTGYLIIVHDLDLAHLSHDIAGFEPSVYSMLASGSPLLSTSAYRQLLDRKRNHVEVIYDFPTGDEAMMIASLEWTCVHDIQDLPPRQESDAPAVEEQPLSQEVPKEAGDTGNHSRREANVSDSETTSGDHCPPTPKKRRRISAPPHPADQDNMRIILQSSSNLTSNYLWSGYALSWQQNLSNSERQVTADHHSDTSDSSDSDDSSEDLQPGSSSQVEATGVSSGEPQLTHLEPQYNITNLLSVPSAESQNKSSHNRRLTHFIEEPNVGRGFIKELSFSPDGCLLASPFSYGVRLLAFDKDCRELCDQAADQPSYPVELYEVGTCMSHTKEVTSVKFSPFHGLVVSGCLSGQVNFHQPVL